MTAATVEVIARNDRLRLVRRDERHYLVIDCPAMGAQYGAPYAFGPIPPDRVERVIDQIVNPDDDCPLSRMSTKRMRLVKHDVGDYPALGWLVDLADDNPDLARDLELEGRNG